MTAKRDLAPGRGPLRDEGSGYPIQLAKVQRPMLRDETLERPRLLDWLRAKIHGRVVLLLADAGYGKTTLLADFSRRTRLRTLWYRMDETDRDWTSFLHHLVAAGREHDPSFAPATASLLGEIGVGGPTRESVLDTFIRELPTIAVQGAVLILDDFHLVDDAVDVRHITRELLARAPERLTTVFASRRLPTVPLSRLRAVGEVAELTTDDLRFDVAETSQLFNETYGRHLAPDVLVDLAHRTEGWIASLQLVQAALRDRSPAEIRRFVRSLNGADHEMYDYLAEEVVGDLSEELQRFLMDTSILQAVTPELAEVVSGQDAAGVARLTVAAERLTLLSRLSGGPRTHQRYHPLVREFLEGRFRSLDGDEAVAGLHRRTAAAATDWRIAAHHYREAGDTVDMLAIVSRAIPTIMGNGQYALAEAFIGPVPSEDRPPGFDLILSRVEMQQGDYDAAIAASQAVLDSATDAIQRDYALLNLVTLNLNYGNGEMTVEYARRLNDVTSDEDLREIAEASETVVLTADKGDLQSAARGLRSMARRQRGGRLHHFGVTMHNIACCSLAQDRIADGLREATEAAEAFGATSAGLELSASLGLEASFLMRLGRVDEANEIIDKLIESPTTYVEHEVYIDLAAMSDSFDDGERARIILERLGSPSRLTTSERRLLAITLGRWHARRLEPEKAQRAIESFPAGLGTNPGLAAEQLVTRAYVATAANERTAMALAKEAVLHADGQGAVAWRRAGQLLATLVDDSAPADELLSGLGTQAPWQLTFVAELLVPHVGRLTPRATSAVETAAELHPRRWRKALRTHLDATSGPALIGPARILERIGEKEDVRRLRGVAKSLKRFPGAGDLGRSLSRRLADRVWIEDQGRTSIHVDQRVIASSAIRRKVLAFLCFLISRGFSATRDQVLDALWPELDPDIAVNSLNQTLYFLRRVFEEDYSDDLSPGYVWHDSDVLWLDPELVRARSSEARALIRSFPSRPSPDDVEQLVQQYRGRFALDFEYEEWAGAYRDSLHASYLEIVERSVLDDFTSGHYDRGISVARRALEVDPTAEQIEVSLLRLYKATGAHSAAAEQYAHYATVMREELGIEPPSLESL